MRSDQIHRALAQGMNRFEVCQLVSKGVKATHKTGSRFEDSINDVLQYLGTHETPKENLHPAIPQVSVKSLKPARRSSCPGIRGSGKALARNQDSGSCAATRRI
jgi:hypothetical protein